MLSSVRNIVMKKLGYVSCTRNGSFRQPQFALLKRGDAEYRKMLGGKLPFLPKVQQSFRV